MTNLKAQFSPTSRLRVLATLGLIALPASFLLALAIGSVQIPPKETLGALFTQLFGGDSAGDSESALTAQIVWQYRAPRTLAAILVGAALAVAGAILQAIVRNPLAEPGIIGVSSGASLAAVITMTSTTGFIGAAIATPLAGFFGAMVTLLLVLILSFGSGGLVSNRIILAGVGVGQLALAATTYVQLKADPSEIKGILFWMMGSVAGTETVQQLLLPAVVVLAATGVAFLFGRSLNALAFGDDDAHSLGVSPSKLRVGMVIVVSVLTGVAVSIGGGVAFIGLFTPHIVRFIVGQDNRAVVPLSALWGAIILVLIDICSRSLAAGQELPLTIFTGAIGAPFFLWLLNRNKSGGAL